MGGKAKKPESPEKERDAAPWHCMTNEEVCKELGLKEDIRRTGLSSAEAAERLEKYGENKLGVKKKVTLLEKIWHHINNVLVGVLIFVAVISAITGIAKISNPVTSWIQVTIIVAVVV